MANAFAEFEPAAVAENPFAEFGFAEEPTPTLTLESATIRSEGQGPEPQESFLEKMKRLAQTPSPELIRKPEEALRQYVTQMIPKTKEAWVQAAGIPTDLTDPRQVIGSLYPFLRGMGGVDLPEHVQQRAEAVAAAEETPPWSQERWTAGVAPVLDIAQIAAGAPLEGVPRIGAGRVAKPLPEAMLAREKAALRAAVKGPEAPTEVITEMARVAPAVEAPLGKEIYAPKIETPRTLLEHEVRPRVGEKAPLRGEPEGIAREEAVPGGGPAPEAAAETVTLYHSTPKKFETFDPKSATQTGLGGKAHYFYDESTPIYGKNVVSIEVPKELLYDLDANPLNLTWGDNVDTILRDKGYAGTRGKAGGEYTIYNPNAFLGKGKHPATPTPEAEAAVAPISKLEQMREAARSTILTPAERARAQKLIKAEEAKQAAVAPSGAAGAPVPTDMINAVRTPSGKITGYNIEHGDMISRLSEQYEPSQIESGWVLNKPTKAERDATFIGTDDVQRHNGDFQAAFEEKTAPTVAKPEVTILPEEARYTREGAPPTTEPPVSEPVPSGEPVTGISKAAIAEQRGARGAPDIERQKQLDFGQSVERAKATLAEDPGAGERLIGDFMEKARPIATEEVPLAIEQLQKVQREFDAATEAVNKATPEELPYAQDRLNNARTQYDLTTEAVQNATSATGAGLNSVKMLLKDDFSLARMEQVARAVINDGKPLSPKQTADVAKLHKRLQVAETKIAGYEAQDAFRAALKEAKAQEKAGFRVADFMDRQAQAARDRIVARRGKLYADPLGVTNVAHLADEAIIGAAHITRGVTRFADWSSAMLREFGDNIKPYLKGLYAKAKELAGNTAKGKLTPEEREARALAGEKKRIRTLTGKMRERLVKRDISPLRQKREPRMDEEKVALLYEREKVKKDYREMLAVEALKRAPWYKKAGRLVSEPLRAVRSLKFSFDASALMQQGGFETFGHPIAQARRVMPMLRAMRSEAGQFKVMNEIQNLPEWKSGEFRQAGVEFGDIDTPILAKREEVFASRLAQKVPGVKMSERGFVTLLNQIRAQRYVALKNDLFGGGLFRKGGELTLNEKKILGNFVNVTTGRGNLGPFKQATMLLNAIFAAPRLRVSNFQLMLGQPIWHKLGSGSGRVRALMLKEYARSYAGIAAAVAAASQIPGVDVELDPRSTDFGQIRIGNLRINPFSRLTSTGVLASRLITGETKTQKGEIKPIYGGEVPYGGTTGIDVAGRYLRGGLTPVIGGIVSGMTGEMVTGEPTTPLKELTSAPLPLSANNLSDALKAENVPSKIIAGILSTTGLGVSHYGRRTGEQKKAEAARLRARDKALLHGDVRQAYELSFRPPEEEGESVAGDVSSDISRRMRMRAVRPSVR